MASLHLWCREGGLLAFLLSMRLPFMDEVDFPPLVGSEFFDVVQHGKPPADSFDGVGESSKPYP